MKRKAIALFTLSVLITMISCDRMLENYWEQKGIENYTSPYKGTYKGSYSGNESGTLSVEVFKSGSIEVIRTNANNYSETFHGAVNDYGAFNTAYSQNTGFQLEGSISANHSTSGTWKMGTQTGSWQLTKQ